MLGFKLPVIVGFLMIPGGLAIIYYSLLNLRKIKLAAESWLVTQGKMLKSELVHFSSKHKHTSLFVKYTYVIKGEEYTSRKISFLEPHTKAHCEDLQSRFPQGETIDIFYDPENPKNAVLVVDISEFPKAKTHGVSMGVLVAGLGVMLLFLNN